MVESGILMFIVDAKHEAILSITIKNGPASDKMEARPVEIESGKSDGFKMIRSLILDSLQHTKTIKKHVIAYFNPSPPAPSPKRILFQYSHHWCEYLEGHIKHEI